MNIFDLLENILRTSFELVEKGIKALLNWNSSSGHPFRTFQAKFASARQLLNKKYKGFCLDGVRQLSRKHSFRNTLVVGGTGVGKSSTILIPSLLSMQGSLIIHDPSGELHQACSKDLENRGYQVSILDFSAPGKSIRYNPIRHVNSQAEANKVAGLLIRHTLGDQKGDPFWNLQATNLLALAIKLVRLEPEARQHFWEVRQIVQRLGIYPDRFLDKLNRIGDLALRQSFEAFLQYDEKVKSGVTATVQSALHLFQDETVSEITKGDSFLIERFRHRKNALFIQSPLADQRYYVPLTSMFFEQLFAGLMRWLPEEGDQDVFCLMDEAGVLRIPSLADVITNVRKYRVGILLSVQDEEQLENQYDSHEAHIIGSNCFSKVFFPGQSLETAKRIEELAGSFIQVNQEGQTFIRPLITRDEVRTLPRSKAILLAGNYAPMLLSMKPYYENRRLKKRLQSHY